jgi:pimeloyl-ACP methyl ester carboxylesterase
MFAPSLGARLAAVEPAMSYTAVPGVGHGVHRERPDVVIAAALGRR